MQAAIAALFVVGGLHYLLTADWASERTLLVLFAGLTLLRLNGALVGTALAAFSRSREFETDAEACQDIASPESLISALEKITVAVKEAGVPLSKGPWHLRTHPTNQARAEALRKLV